MFQQLRNYNVRMELYATSVVRGRDYICLSRKAGHLGHMAGWMEKYHHKELFYLVVPAFAGRLSFMRGQYTYSLENIDFGPCGGTCLNMRVHGYRVGMCVKNLKRCQSR